MNVRIAIGACLAGLGLAGCVAARQEPAGSAPGRTAPEAPARETPAVHLVPYPQSVTPLDGFFELSDPVRIVTRSQDARVGEIATFLADVVRERTGFDVRVDDESPRDADRAEDVESGTPTAIVLSVAAEESGEAEAPGAESVDPDSEAYALRVTGDGVAITGAGSAGLLWGVQTLRQLLPPEFEDPDGLRPDVWTVPAVHIVDGPRFGWRGSLMDVSRHFFPVDFVKRYVDLLSRYKMNVLHWHLTEDQGWRLEIDAYPRLTEVAAWRTEPDGSRHGGFYTKEDVREVVDYARLRGVRVVPEIEMPGHSSAALVAYPELACADPPEEVPSSRGVFRDIYCVGEPETLVFLENVLTEVAALFPSEHIHVGGDEVPKTRWEECESCQELMAREGLEDEGELQAWFLRRIQQHLDGLGKTMIGWDEILDGGGVPGAVVQIWRDPATIREAIGRGHDVVASPTSHAYFDYSPAALSLQQVYSFDPTAGAAPDPKTRDGAPERRGRVLGGEGNLWSEYITTANFDLQAFPRILALSEVLWSGPATDERDFAAFEARLDADQYPRLRALGVRPGPEATDVVRMEVGTDPASGAPRVSVEASVADIEVRYTTDGSTPSSASPLVTDATIFEDGDDVTLGVFAAGAPIPIRRGFSIVDHLARGRSVTLEHPPDARYAGPSPDALTDGLRGSENHRDGVWQGWWDDDLDATIDLGGVHAVRVLELSFLENEGAWILPPDSVSVFTSPDGETWTQLDASWPAKPARGAGAGPATRLVVSAGFAGRPNPLEVRYLRFDAARAILPDGHPGAGETGWLFVDEVVVR